MALCGHVRPDGDCIGSQLALSLALRSRGVETRCLLVADEPIDEGLRFLPGAGEMVFAGRVAGAFDAFVAVDVPTAARIGEEADALRRACPLTVAIDHHPSEAPLGRLAFIDPDSPSASMLVWELAKEMGCEDVEGVAACCYTGLLTDTGRFQFQNTTAAALASAADMVAHGADPACIAREVFQSRSRASLRLQSLVIGRMRFSEDGACVASWLDSSDFSACGAVPADAEGLVDVIRSIRGVRVCCLLREQDGKVRGNLRAKDDTDVSRIARALGGGGHRAAAGFSLEGGMEPTLSLVLSRMRDAVAGGSGSEGRE